MPTSLKRLGELIRMYREAKALSQEDLAERIRPPTNRSLVAHLEQGLRLPPVLVLRRICIFLDVPEALWRPFELASFRARTIQEAEFGGTTHALPSIIAVSGMMGSGKTTLARKIAASMGYAYTPESASGRNYIADLIADQRRWAFETQLAFLCDKAIQISEAIQQGQRVIVDRSLSEDVNIFARYFYESGDIDKRSYETYSELAKHFLATLPQPDLIIYCQCTPELAWERIKERGRSDLRLHTPEHLARIAALYNEWASTQRESTVLAIDGNSVDWRDPLVVQRIYREIEDHWSAPESHEIQLQLFGEEKASPNSSVSSATPLLRPVFEVSQPVGPRRITQMATQPSRPNDYPIAYLAAPFTTKAVPPKPDSKKKELFSQLADHGRIARGSYRTGLANIEKALATLGVATLLPHRDVNRWGARSLKPDEVMKLCTEHVARCDLMVAILGESHGAHYEYGLARGMSKPCIVISTADVRGSFMASGVRDVPESVLHLKCDKLSNAPELLTSEQAIEFLRRFFPI